MKWSEFFYSLQPLLVCHALPGLLGGFLRWLYLMRTGRSKDHPWRTLLMDAAGGLLVGTIMGPALSPFATIPDKPFAMLDIVRGLPSWFAERWLVSAMVGLFWLTAVETAKERVTSLVRQHTNRPPKKALPEKKGER